MEELPILVGMRVGENVPGEPAEVGAGAGIVQDDAEPAAQIFEFILTEVFFERVGKVSYILWVHEKLIPAGALPGCSKLTDPHSDGFFDS